MKRVGLYTRRATKVGVNILQAELDELKNSACIDSEATTSEYMDNGYSGIRFNRPALKQMLKDCKEGKLDAIVIPIQGRLARNADVFHKIYKVLKERGVALYVGNNKYEHNDLFDIAKKKYRRLANGT